MHDKEAFHAIAGWSSGRAPHRKLSEILPDVVQQDVSLHGIYDRTVGWSVDVPELTAMLCIIGAIGAQRIVEIGTFDGFTAMNFAANLSKDGMVTTIDLPPEHRDDIPNAIPHNQIGVKYRDTPYARRINQVYGDSTELDWDSLDGPFDFAFIDGCHEYEFVVKDTQHVLKHLRKGGVVAWHDYGAFPSVSRAVDEAAESLDVSALLGTRLAIGRIPQG